MQTLDLVFGTRTITGSLTGSSIDNEDNLRFAQRQGVRSMNEVLPLSDAPKAYRAHDVRRRAVPRRAGRRSLKGGNRGGRLPRSPAGAPARVAEDKQVRAAQREADAAARTAREPQRRVRDLERRLAKR